MLILCTEHSPFYNLQKPDIERKQQHVGVHVGDDATVDVEQKGSVPAENFAIRAREQTIAAPKRERRKRKHHPQYVHVQLRKAGIVHP